MQQAGLARPSFRRGYRMNRIAAFAAAALPVAVLPLMAMPAHAGPHEHGIGHLQVALDGRALAVELRLPAKDVVGFERAPRNDAERARIDEARAALANAALFTPAAAAQCASKGADVTLPQFSGKSGGADDHADFEAVHRFDCANAAALAALEHGVFKAFPKIKQLRAQALTARGQKQVILTHGKPRLAF
jgi:hypothetical protein